MNFLAHALLAGSLESDQVGGLIGDLVKGPLPAGLPMELASGVALHRAIDTFADRHPAFLASRARISPLRRRVSGVLVDLFYDHLLARDWLDRGHGTLTDYTAKLYAILHAHTAVLSENGRETIKLMRRHDWLCGYRNIEAIGRTIDRMAVYRLQRATTLAGGIEEFFADIEGFEADFRAFLPDAQDFAADWRLKRDTSLSA